MTNQTIVVAGATGELGGRIVRELVRRESKVRTLVRPSTDARRVSAELGDPVEVVQVDFDSEKDLAKACEGASIVVCALSGLEDVIVGVQGKLLDAAVAAGVPRFMPSDFAIDFTRIPEGWNRNLNLRNQFRSKVEGARIQATSILNGAFTEMLTGVAPFILFGPRRILCWGDADQPMNWTTMRDTATYAAAAAMDPSTPRFLRISADLLTANGLAEMMTELTGKKHKLFRPGGPGLLRFLISVTKATSPKTKDIYPPWQGMQYMHNMYAGLGHFSSLDNDRYPMQWRTAREVLQEHLSKA